MKRLVFSIVVMLSCFIPAMAEEGDIYFNVAGGVQINNTLNATLGFEKELANGDALQFYVEGGNHWGYPVCHNFWTGYFWDGGVNYKYQLSKFKNGGLGIRGGINAGEWLNEFTFGAELSLEYNYIFSNEWEIVISQKNNMNFLKGDKMRNGLMLGVKIPL